MQVADQPVGGEAQLAESGELVGGNPVVGGGEHGRDLHFGGRGRILNLGDGGELLAGLVRGGLGLGRAGGRAWRGGGGLGGVGHAGVDLPRRGGGGVVAPREQAGGQSHRRDGQREGEGAGTAG